MSPECARQLAALREGFDGEAHVVADHGHRLVVCLVPRLEPGEGVIDRDWSQVDEPALVLIDPARDSVEH